MALDVSAYHDFSEDLIGSLKIYARTINGIDSDVRLTEQAVYTSQQASWF